MNHHAAAKPVAGTTPVRTQSFLRRRRDAGVSFDRIAAGAAAEDEALLFDQAPVTEIDLPADGGAEPGVPYLAVLGPTGGVEAAGNSVGTNAARARQAMLAMLRRANRAAG